MDGVLEWLLDSDPALRWQVLQDLVGAPADQVARERARVAREGWGAELLAAQDPDGRWAGSLYSPKWTSTTYTLLLLHRLGLEPGHGTWPMHRPYPGRQWFRLDAPGASRWSTFRALRVLQWWEGS